MIACDVAYRPPFDWPALLAFLERRAITGVELVSDGRYVRTVSINGHAGWISVEPPPGRNVLRVTMAASLAPVLVPVVARVKRLFDTAADPCRIAARLGALAERSPGLRVPGAFNGFEIAVRAILGQQVSVPAATTIAGRFAAAFGAPADTPYAQLSRHVPAPDRIAAASESEIASIGIPRARARTLQALATSIVAGDIALEPASDVEQTMVALKELPGIGEWTAQYVAMRALGWPDAFPHTDLGVLRALGLSGAKGSREALARAAAWQPWRSYAVIHLWRSLEER